MVIAVLYYGSRIQLRIDAPTRQEIRLLTSARGVLIDLRRRSFHHAATGLGPRLRRRRARARAARDPARGRRDPRARVGARGPALWPAAVRRPDHRNRARGRLSGPAPAAALALPAVRWEVQGHQGAAGRDPARRDRARRGARWRIDP